MQNKVKRDALQYFSHQIEGNELPRRRAAGYQVVIPESPKGLSVVRHTHHPEQCRRVI
jgi:hypothetical protein